jgi:predicted aspartyl protease
MIEPSGLVDVPVQLAGHPANLRLDTGDIMSMLSETSATALGLPRDHVPYHEWILYAGARAKEFAIADSVRFGRFNAPAAKFVVVTDNGLPFDIAGKISADILRQYDIEFDLPHDKLNIYSPGQCANVWPAGAATLLAMDVTGKGRIIVDVQLDGKPVKALLDTGLAVSVLSLNAGKELFGISEKTPGLKALATHYGAAYLLSYPFKSLAFQGVTVANPDIEIETTLPQRPDLIIGANILRLLHFCIAYDAERLYVALPATH